MPNRTFKAALMALALIGPTTAMAAPTVIDFEEPGALGLPSYVKFGVTFTSGDPSSVNLLTGANNSGNLIGRYDETGVQPGFGSFDWVHAAFDSVVGFVSVDLGDYPSTFDGEGDSETLFLNAFDVNNLFIGGMAIDIGEYEQNYRTLSVSGPGIKSVAFGAYAGFGGSSVYADNFTFDAAVPEPSTWALMILGFGSAGLMIRRRRTLAQV